MKNKINSQLQDVRSALINNGVVFDTSYNKIQDVVSYYSDDSLSKALETVFEYMKESLEHSLLFQEGLVFGDGQVDAIDYIDSIMSDKNRNILSKSIVSHLQLTCSLGFAYDNNKKEIDRHIEISQIIERVFPQSILDAAKFLADNDIVTVRKELYSDKENSSSGHTYKLYKKSAVPFVASALIAQSIAPYFIKRIISELNALSSDVEKGKAGEMGKVINDTVTRIINENKNSVVCGHKCDNLKNVFSTLLKSSYYNRANENFSNLSLMENINSVITPEMIFDSINNIVNDYQKEKSLSRKGNSFGF